MTIKELEAKLGLTLHDAQLDSLSVDYVKRTANFIMDICVGDPEAKAEKDRERWRKGRLSLTGLQYLVIDPPDPTYLYNDPSAVDLDPCDADQEIAPRYRIPDDGFEGRFFVSDWNAFIHFAATNATLNWLNQK